MFVENLLLCALIFIWVIFLVRLFYWLSFWTIHARSLLSLIKFSDLYQFLVFLMNSWFVDNLLLKTFCLLWMALRLLFWLWLLLWNFIPWKDRIFCLRALLTTFLFSLYWFAHFHMIKNYTLPSLKSFGQNFFLYSNLFFFRWLT